MKKVRSSAAKASLSAASLGQTHGYQLDGDVATLNAEIVRCSAKTGDCDWRVQLWACPAPFNGGHIEGTKVADVPVKDLNNTPTHISASALATPPAGQQYHSMVMVLASQEVGKFATIHDYANYPLRQAFALPRMLGNVSFRLDEATVRIDVDAIENPRDADNLSGTLSLELWALAEPYQGGEFAGTQLAGVSIGTLTGQTTERNLTFILPRMQGVAGKAHMVLMLREWTVGGYITRDFTNFVEPVQFPEPAPQQKNRADKTTKVLSAVLQSVKPAAKKRVSIAAAVAPSKEDVLRGRGKGRKLLAKLTAVTKSDARQQ